MTNKTLFWSFYVSFCTFYASLRLKRTVFTRPKTSVSSVAKNPLNPCNLFTPLETCLLFLMGRNPWLINNLRACNALYNCKETFTDVKKTLQIKLFMQNKAKFQKVKFNVNRVLTKDYDPMDTWSIRKTKPIQSQFKPNSKPIQTQLKPKQTQFKPKQSQFQRQKILTFLLRCFGAGADYSYILIGQFVAFILGRRYRNSAVSTRNTGARNKLSAEINSNQITDCNWEEKL